MSHWYLLDDDCEWESFFSDPQNPGRASQMKPELNNNNSETMQQCTVEYIQYIFHLVCMSFIFKVTKKMIPIPNHRPTNRLRIGHFELPKMKPLFFQFVLRL